MTVHEPIKITFPQCHHALAIRIRSTAEVAAALDAIGLRGPCVTIVLIGGASGLERRDRERLRPLFEEALAPIVHEMDASVVDGGTDAGVMRLMGRARARSGGTFPLVGVAAIGTVALPAHHGSRPHAAPLEPHHTHFVLVPGERWGDESPWISTVAGLLGSGEATATLLVNGGEIAWQDVSQSVTAGRPVVVVAGTGRTADRLAASLDGDAVDQRAEKLVASGLLRAVNLNEGLEALSGALRQVLTTGSART